MKSQLKKAYGIAVALGCLFALFQNCSSPIGSLGSNSVLQSNARESTSLEGNGHGYDGKTFVNPDVDKVCPSGPKGIITKNADGKSFLIRKDCVDIAPIKLAKRDVLTFFMGETYLVYDNKVYMEEASAEDSMILVVCRKWFNPNYLVNFNIRYKFANGALVSRTFLKHRPDSVENFKVAMAVTELKELPVQNEVRSFESKKSADPNQIAASFVKSNVKEVIPWTGQLSYSASFKSLETGALSVLKGNVRDMECFSP